MSVFANDDSALSIREEKARRNSQEAMNFLVNDFHSMASIMKRYYPLAILSRAAWHRYEVESGGKADAMALAGARILPVLLQSIFTSRYYDGEGGFSSQQEIRTKDWQRLRSLADDAVRRLVRLVECRAVLAVRQGQVPSSDFIAYRERLFLQLFGYDVSRQDMEAFRFLFESVFVGDEQMVADVFHTDSDSLVKDLSVICSTMMDGIGDLVEETRRLNDEIRDKVASLQAEKSMLTRQLAVDEVVAKGGYRPRLEALGAKANGYEIFSVEMASLMSSDTCRMFSSSASSRDDVIEDGFLSAALHPFVRFADRYYCFLGPSLFSFILHSIRRVMQDAGVKPASSSKMDRLFNHFVLYLFRQSDVEDVYTYKGYKIDVIRLSSLRFVNAYMYPEVFATRMNRRRSEEAIRPALGHVQLFVDPDTCAPLEKVRDDVWRISLAALAALCSCDESCDAFYRTVFRLDDREDYPDEEEFDDVFSEEVDDSQSSWDVPLDDVPAQVLSDDDSEYDRADDDEKARMLEARFEAEDAAGVPDEEMSPAAKVEDISQYELPEGMAEEPVTEELDELESDDFLPEDGPLGDDDDDGDVEEDSFMLLDDDGDEVGDDDVEDDVEDLAEEEEPAVLGEDEEYMEDDVEDDDVCYVPYDDPDQLRLFDDDGNPAVACDGCPDEDDLVGDDMIEEDTCDLVAEDGVDPDECDLRSEGSVSVSVQGLPREAGALDDEDETPSADDGPDCDVACRGADVVEASEEEEADEADDEPPVIVDDDPDEDVDPETAEREEATLSSQESEESQEAEQEEDMLAGGLDEVLSGTDDDIVVEDDASYGGTAEFIQDDETAEAGQEGYDMSHLPVSIAAILRAMGDRPLGSFVSLVERADNDTLAAMDDAIRKAVTASRSEGRDKMLVVPSAGLSLVVTGSERFDDLRRMEIRNNAGAQMYARGADSWSFALLSYDSREDLVFAWCDEIAMESFSSSDLKIVKVLGEELKKDMHR